MVQSVVADLIVGGVVVVVSVVVVVAVAITVAVVVVVVMISCYHLCLFFLLF